eukprot:SAG25_NODE_373_length_8948_cov_6.275059_17_plen_166_part_00
MQDPGDRLQRMGRLTEEILLDNNSRILEERLNFLRHNQKFRKRVASMAAVKNPHNAAKRVGTVYLPANTPGSPKYQKQLVEKALTVVKRLGHPTYFLTFTCKPTTIVLQPSILTEPHSHDATVRTGQKVGDVPNYGSVRRGRGRIHLHGPVDGHRCGCSPSVVRR